jgi:sugar phosphate isomerase/epimerase
LPKSLAIGLNPYGLAYTVGLQGAGTPRANPHPIGMRGFIDLAHEAGVRCIELDHRWLTPLSEDELAGVRRSLGPVIRVASFWLAHEAGETLADAIRCTRAIGASIIRFHLTPVVEGGRAALGARWTEMVEHAKATLTREAPKVADAGLTLAIENHQDFGSEELLDLCQTLGDHVGIVMDTGNPFSVGEDPVAFARRAAERIRHVHLKDYIAQFSDEGYRLVRCAIGDGCVPFTEILHVLETSRCPLAASIEPGALEARHIRLFTARWWAGYPPRDAREIAIMLGRLREKHLDEEADYRTPWETNGAPDIVSAYERAQVQRSLDNVRARGWL